MAPWPKLPISASKHQGAIFEIGKNALKGHFGIELECTKGPFWHTHRAAWTEGPFYLDKLGCNNELNFLM